MKKEYINEQLFIYFFTKLLVCNYGPGGNYLNSPVYTVGSVAGNDCPGQKDDGLCIPEEAGEGSSNSDQTCNGGHMEPLVCF
jgi:hypothetical protein